MNKFIWIQGLTNTIYSAIRNRQYKILKEPRLCQKTRNFQNRGSWGQCGPEAAFCVHRGESKAREEIPECLAIIRDTSHQLRNLESWCFRTYIYSHQGPAHLKGCETQVREFLMFSTSPDYQSKLDFSDEARIVGERNRDVSCHFLDEGGQPVGITTEHMIIVEMFYTSHQLLGVPLLSNPLTDPVPLYSRAAMRKSWGREVHWHELLFERQWRTAPIDGAAGRYIHKSLELTQLRVLQHLECPEPVDL